MIRSESQVAGEIVSQSQRSWRRRQYVVDARYQLRAGVLVGIVAVALLILLNISLVAQERTGRGGPPSAAAARFGPGPDRVSWTLLLMGSAVFAAGVIAIGVLESHRTAGAAYSIRRGVEEIRAGQAGVRIRLRRGDHLQDLAASVNRLAEAIDAERRARV